VKSRFAYMVLLGLAISAVTLVVLKGGKNMSMLNNDTEASIGLPLLDTHLPGRFETATFALG